MTLKLKVFFCLFHREVLFLFGVLLLYWFLGMREKMIFYEAYLYLLYLLYEKFFYGYREANIHAENLVSLYPKAAYVYQVLDVFFVQVCCLAIWFYSDDIPRFIGFTMQLLLTIFVCRKMKDLVPPSPRFVRKTVVLFVAYFIGIFTGYAIHLFQANH